ncbi:ABC transporter substrate-binding protein [Sporomusa sp.]|uniref:ABC transporter substrate-binding protein n=1 Tax=Sporomusa sp. TaxID=2078658 RepID=UPI002C6357C0|nr:ABC transporter substrate-binding protein [Sporomusa sp.]HWR06585.1 ABC transporter substrate-binding protein [Sporomusa sp.]
MRKTALVLSLFFLLLLLAACGKTPVSGGGEDKSAENAMVTVTDQLGRQVEIPRHIQRIAALDHFEGHIAFALGQQDKLVHQALYGKLGQAMIEADAGFRAKPQLRQEQKTITTESLAALNPQVIFINSSFNQTQLQQFESAGMKVIALKGETLEDSYAAVRLMAKVLGSEDRGEKYITACDKLLQLVKDRTGAIPLDKRLNVVFTGPRDIFSVATKDMLQSYIIETAGGKNAAGEIKGYWITVSPEQISTWNPDVIFLGSSLDAYSPEALYSNPHFATVKAAQNKRVYSFPSTIGWWDYPAPRHVLGTIWAAKTLYPEKFSDIDMTKVADEFYSEFLGHSFTELGGKL